MNGITSHVLDTSIGKPAENIGIVLDKETASGWQQIYVGATNADGRVPNMILEGTRVEPGTYRLTFDTAPYFAAAGEPSFYSRVEIFFEIKDPSQHYHVPLLISPFGYSTYRGS